MLGGPHHFRVSSIFAVGLASCGVWAERGQENPGAAGLKLQWAGSARRALTLDERRPRPPRVLCQHSSWLRAASAPAALTCQKQIWPPDDSFQPLPFLAGNKDGLLQAVLIPFCCPDMTLETECNGNTRLRGRHEVFMGSIQGVKRSLYQIILDSKEYHRSPTPAFTGEETTKKESY